MNLPSVLAPRRAAGTCFPGTLAIQRLAAFGRHLISGGGPPGTVVGEGAEPSQDRLGVLGGVICGEFSEFDAIGAGPTDRVEQASGDHSAPSTFATLRNQQRWGLACPKTPQAAFHKPSAPPPMASTGASIPRRAQLRSRSAHDSADSRKAGQRHQFLAPAGAHADHHQLHSLPTPSPMPR